MYELRVVVDMEIVQPLVAFQLELAGIDDTTPGARTPRVLDVNDFVDLGLDCFEREIEIKMDGDSFFVRVGR